MRIDDRGQFNAQNIPRRGPVGRLQRRRNNIRRRRPGGRPCCRPALFFNFDRRSPFDPLVENAGSYRNQFIRRDISRRVLIAPSIFGRSSTCRSIPVSSGATDGSSRSASDLVLAATTRSEARMHCVTYPRLALRWRRRPTPRLPHRPAARERGLIWAAGGWDQRAGLARELQSRMVRVPRLSAAARPGRGPDRVGLQGWWM